MMLLIFRLDNWKCALHISTVDRVYRAVAITALPETPEIVLGIINVRGNILPAINLRSRFHLPPKALTPSAQLIVARMQRRPVALIVDSVEDVIECDEREIVSAHSILPGMEHVQGVLRLKDGMILIQDLDSLLSLEEEALMDKALVG